MNNHTNNNNNANNNNNKTTTTTIMLDPRCLGLTSMLDIHMSDPRLLGFRKHALPKVSWG
jgi:hypothetical protein